MPKIKSLICSLFLCFLIYPEPVYSQSLPLKFPKEWLERYSFPIALGSGLTYVGRDEEAEYYYALTDDGPSVYDDCEDEELKQAARSFKPLFGKIRVTDKAATVLWLREIHSDKNIDPEGIAVADDGNLWIVEEVKPSLLLIDKESAQVLKRYKPGKGLPKSLKDRFEGRGLEALTKTPSGKLALMMQSPLDKKDSDDIRLVLFDPETESFEQYRYDISTYKEVSDIRICAIEALTDSKFVIVERTFRKSGWEGALVTIELVRGDKKKGEARPTRKRLLPIDGSLKIEGLAPYKKNRLLLMNDNDFGVESCEVREGVTTQLYFIDD